MPNKQQQKLSKRNPNSAEFVIFAAIFVAAAAASTKPEHKKQDTRLNKTKRRQNAVVPRIQSRRMCDCNGETVLALERVKCCKIGRATKIKSKTKDGQHRPKKKSSYGNCIGSSLEKCYSNAECSLIDANCSISRSCCGRFSLLGCLTMSEG